MSSTTSLLFSEGQSILVNWDNGVTIHYPLSNDMVKAIDDVVIRKIKKTKVGGLSISRDKETDIIMVELHMENGEVRFALEMAGLYSRHR